MLRKIWHVAKTFYFKSIFQCFRNICWSYDATGWTNLFYKRFKFHPTPFLVHITFLRFKLLTFGYRFSGKFFKKLNYPHTHKLILNLFWCVFLCSKNIRKPIIHHHHHIYTEKLKIYFNLEDILHITSVV